MKKNTLILLILSLIAGFCACKSTTTSPKPETLLSLDSVAVLVADCFIIESEVYVKQWHYNMKDYATVKYDSFFEERGITKEILIENIRYYFTHEEYSEILMNKVDEIVEHHAAVLCDTLKFLNL